MDIKTEKLFAKALSATKKARTKSNVYGMNQMTVEVGIAGQILKNGKVIGSYRPGKGSSYAPGKQPIEGSLTLDGVRYSFVGTSDYQPYKKGHVETASVKLRRLPSPRSKNDKVHGYTPRKGIRCPSAKNLEDAFRITRAQANQIRALCKAADDPEKLEELIEKKHPETNEYVRRMHSSPYDSHMWRRTVVLDAINNVIEGYGVEALGEGRRYSDPPPYEYINMGDTYATTLIYKSSSDNLFIGSWGDLVERNPRLGD